MITRTWPYGTTYRVTVKAIYHKPKAALAVCTLVSNPQEAFLLMDAPEAIDATAGEERTIVFTEGGPTGGFWKFEARKAVVTP